MSEAKPSSFLAGVKSELTQLFADAFDEIAGELGDSVPGIIPEAMQRLQKRTWTLVEQGLKTSFLNGRNTATRRGEQQPSERDAPAEAPKSAANPFRKA